MSLKQKLQELKNTLQEYIFHNRNYEFEAELEDCIIPGNQNIYRLYYINYYRIGESYCMGPDNIELVNWPFQPLAV